LNKPPIPSLLVPNPASAADRETSVSKFVILEVAIGSIWFELDIRPLGTFIKKLKSLDPNPLLTADAEINESEINEALKEEVTLFTSILIVVESPLVKVICPSEIAALVIESANL
jgi:hypothetical protein